MEHYCIILSFLGQDQLHLKGLSEHFKNGMKLGKEKSDMLYIFFTREDFHIAIDLLIDKKIKAVSISWNY